MRTVSSTSNVIRVSFWWGFGHDLYRAVRWIVITLIKLAVFVACFSAMIMLAHNDEALHPGTHQSRATIEANSWERLNAQVRADMARASRNQ